MTATAWPALHLRGVDDRADAGEHGAAEQRRLVERQVRRRSSPASGARRPRESAKAEHAEMVVDRASPSQCSRARARQQRAGAVGGRARLAQRRTPFGAGRAMAAARHEDHDDMIADARGRCTPRPSSSTTPAASWPSAIGIGRGRSPLMTERSEWHSPAGHDRPAPRPGRADRARVPAIGAACLGVGRLGAHAVQDRGSDPHVTFSACGRSVVCFAPSGRGGHRTGPDETRAPRGTATGRCNSGLRGPATGRPRSW